MSNVIEFLEKMGQDAQLRNASAEVVNLAMCSVGVDSAVQAAILNKDQKALESLLGANTNVCCMIQAESNDEIISAKEESIDFQHSASSVSSVA